MQHPLLDDIHAFEQLAALLPARGKMKIVQRFVVRELQIDHSPFVWGDEVEDSRRYY